MLSTSPEAYLDNRVEAIEPARNGWVQRSIQRLFAPVDIAPLIFFRISFGLLMLFEVGGYTFSGYLRGYLSNAQIHFVYYGFTWVSPPPGNWLYALAAVVMLSAVGLMLGLYYHFCALVFALSFTWVFLTEQANYLNHFYLIC